MINRTIPAAAIAICASVLLSGCATDSDGRRLTMTEQWRAMVARQDAAARGFVDTDKDFAGTRDPMTGGDVERTNRSARLIDTGAL